MGSNAASCLIKQEMRLGSLSSVKKALLPCIAAVGGMITPMLIYFLVQVRERVSSKSLVSPNLHCFFVDSSKQYFEVRRDRRRRYIATGES